MMDVSRESLIDEVFILRNRVATLTRENEGLLRLLAQAEMRIEELEAEIEAITEQQEEPFA